MKKDNNYEDIRKQTVFNSDLNSRTLLISKMWDMNDTIFNKWKDVKLLLDIVKQKDRISISKGLNSIAKTLRDIADELEKSCEDLKLKKDKEEIIDYID